MAPICFRPAPHGWATIKFSVDATVFEAVEMAFVFRAPLLVEETSQSSAVAIALTSPAFDNVRRRRPALSGQLGQIEF